MEIKLDEGYYEAQCDWADHKLDEAKEQKLVLSDEEFRKLYPWYKDKDDWRDT